MKTAIFATVLAVSFVGLGYVRREWRPTAASQQAVDGSRDRTLPGKQRRTARKANHG